MGAMADVCRAGAERNHHHLLSQLHIQQAAKQNNGETGSFEVCSLSLQKQLLSLRLGMTKKLRQPNMKHGFNVVQHDSTYDEQLWLYFSLEFRCCVLTCMQTCEDMHAECTYTYVRSCMYTWILTQTRDLYTDMYSYVLY